MSLADSPPTVSSFQRLEDFPSYISCIKCFGKPIISPLVTRNEKFEISAFKKAAIRKEADVLNLKKENSSLSTKVRDVYYKVQEHLVSYNEDDLIPNCKFLLPGKSALSLNSMNAQLSSSNVTYFVDEMHVSTSKLPSSGICSTVHQGVIVCPNEISTGKKYDDMSNIPSRCSLNPSDQKLYCHQFLNSECHLCQVDCPRDFRSTTENISNEQIYSVSDDEQGGYMMEDTDFESLPTVISAKKFNLQDTDDESNVTCLTQSTDLDKYMDCSIEFSSPDDLIAMANSQMSSQNTMSCRSDDASSETLVNTESELTPCASAMAELNGYSDDTQYEIAEPQSSVSCIETSASNMQDRAYSVDSYMEILKTCTQNSENLNMKKSQSEPSHSNALQQSEILRDFLFPEKTSALLLENLEDKVDSKSDDTEKSKVSELAHAVVEDCMSTRSISKSKSEESSSHKKTHVRTSSYTLDYPSSALIMAHANCDCESCDADNTSPHSCSTPEKKNKVLLNPAFKKEKVNVVLPPTPDRDKLFPILNTAISFPSDTSSIQNSNSDLSMALANSTSVSHSLDTSLLPIVGNSENLNDSTKNHTIQCYENSDADNNSVECPIESVNTESIGSHQSNSNVKLSEIPSVKANSECIDSSFCNKEMKNLPSNISEEGLDTNNQVIQTSSMADIRKDNVQHFLNEIFKDIQESQKMRVNKLLDEQNKQWLQLHEEFKEQERLLCAKLNLVNIPSVSDHDFSGMSSQHFSDNLSDRGDMKEMPTKQNIRPNANASIISDISNKECLITSETGNRNCYSEHQLLINSNNIQELKTSSILSNNSEASTVPTAYGDLKFLPSNISLDRSDEMKSNSCVESASAIEDTAAIFSDRLEVTASRDSPIYTNDCSHGSLMDHLNEGVQSSSSTKSPLSADCESENFTTNTSLSRTSDVPSSLSLSQNNDVFPCVSSCSENSHKTYYQNSNILLQSTYDLPGLIKYFPLPVSSLTSEEATNMKRSSSSQNYEIHQGGCELQQQFSGDREICSLSPVSPCICFAVHQQEFNADCPHCHACMNCDTNCLKHLNYSKTNFGDLNGYGECEDAISMKYDNLKENCSGFSPENPGQDVNNENVKNDSFHAHILKTKACVDKECSLKRNIEDKKKMYLWQKVCNVNMKKDAAVKTNNLIRSSGLKSTSNEKMHPCSGSSYNFCKSHEVRLKNSNVSKSPNKGERDFPMNQKSKKILMDAYKTDTLKRMATPSFTNLKCRPSKDILETIKDPSIQKKLEKLPALVKGYLTRRLFQSERVQDLIKTLKDTVLIIGKLSEELTSKGNPVSEQDVDFHRQLIVQLMTTFRNVYDIFCTYSIKEQMQIISESRSFQLKKRATELSQVSLSVPVVTESSNSSIPPKKSKLSAATVKSLERKRRSTIDSRTYTIEDFKGCRPRICTKSRVTSPSRIYKSAVDLNLKSKTRGLKTQHWK